ncbi:MAG: patatin-like phospholipase family protein [Acidimicrobiales bacterium]
MIDDGACKAAGTNAVVLSGGASLGAVQVGMLRALVEAGIAVDLLVGTSVGAINAAWMAGRPTLDGLEELAEVWMRLSRRDVFPVKPVYSLFAAVGRRPSLVSSASLRSLLERHIAFDRLEDATVPLHVVAVDVQSGEDVLLSAGSAVDAVLASAAIPGLFPPVEIEGRWFMDGGVVNNTPISYAAGLGARTVWVLPAGYPCALAAPPTTALAMALQGLSTLVEHRLVSDAERLHDSVELRVVPPLCPLDVSPADFSHTAELLQRGYASTAGWLAAGCPDVRAMLLPHHHGKTALTQQGPPESALRHRTRVVGHGPPHDSTTTGWGRQR